MRDMWQAHQAQSIYTSNMKHCQYILCVLCCLCMPDKALLNFLVETDLLKRIDDFRFKNRFESRAAAIKWLLDWALNQKPAVKQE